MDFTNLIQGAIGQQVVGTAAKQLGINESQAQIAVTAAVPFLLTALNKNAQNGDAEGISKALDQHNGSILDNLSGFLGQGGNQQDGLGILGHILGNKQQNVESTISQQSGLNIGQVTQILALVAPIIMGYLGKQKQSEGLDSKGIVGLLGDLVSGSTTQTNQSGVNLGGFEKLLDQDGDGKLGIGDAMGLLGSFFKK